MPPIDDGLNVRALMAYIFCLRMSSLASLSGPANLLLRAVTNVTTQKKKPHIRIRDIRLNSNEFAFQLEVFHSRRSIGGEYMRQNSQCVCVCGK